MTVAIGLVCSDGVIVASDSMISTGVTAFNAQKTFTVPGLPVAWAGAGQSHTIDEAARTMQSLPGDGKARDALLKGDLGAIKARLTDRLVRETMKRCYDSVIPTTSAATYNFPVAEFIILGWGKERPYALLVATNGEMNWRHDVGFVAIGSGHALAMVANSLLAHYIEGEPITVQLGQRLAYRTIETICAVASQAIGPPVQMAIADRDGARIVPQDDLDAIGEAVAGWKRIEADTFRRDGQPLPVQAIPVVKEAGGGHGNG